MQQGLMQTRTAATGLEPTGEPKHAEQDKPSRSRWVMHKTAQSTTADAEMEPKDAKKQNRLQLVSAEEI